MANEGELGNEFLVLQIKSLQFSLCLYSVLENRGKSPSVAEVQLKMVPWKTVVQCEFCGHSLYRFVPLLLLLMVNTSDDDVDWDKSGWFRIYEIAQTINGAAEH